MAASERTENRSGLPLKKERRKGSGKQPKQAVLSGKTEILRRNRKEKQLLYLTVTWISACRLHYCQRSGSHGEAVTMFYLLGLNALRRPDKVKVKKPFLDRMFMMMPREQKLKLST
ncbi:MAG: DsrE/DsrF/DrsH-like family protein [Eisenbergiella massiliensis]